MQFVKNGPDVPESLLQAHEDGTVVFFCGAGVSYPSGLPGFKGLVDKIYEALHVPRRPVEAAAYEKQQYDRVIGHLESRFTNGRVLVRKALAEKLQPASGESETHSALLDLARSRSDQSTRIITTNFDLLFENRIRAGQPKIPTHVAPQLPVPKPSRWNGLVYLHGRLPLPEDDAEEKLQNLVVSSGDFGLAYLTEGWAARFLSEVFRNYDVCFAGYGLGDPVLRYLVDAVSADRQRREPTRAVYAFVEDGQGAAQPWEAGGIFPIKYSSSDGDHAALHGTLREWARTYRQGAFGKEAIVARHAHSRPTESTLDDDFVGRMRWALSDVTGIPAKRFAEMTPAPPVEWLEPLTDTSGGAPLLSLPDLAGHGAMSAPKFHLLKWLCRHLDEPEALLWAAGCPDRPAGRFVSMASQALTDAGETLGPIRAAWQLLLSGFATQDAGYPDLFDWLRRFTLDGPTLANRAAIRRLLAPRLTLRRLPDYRKKDPTAAPVSVSDIFDCSIALRTRDVPLHLAGILQSGRWLAAPGLPSDLHNLVRDALDLLRAVGDADDEFDGTIWSLPSISPHPQNRTYVEWVWLVEQLRDAWLAALEHDPARARATAALWWTEPYPLFKRLALFAATRDGVDEEGRWLDELLANDALWLWTPQVKRETIRALVGLGPRLDANRLRTLEEAILAGPPKRIFRNPRTDPQELAQVVERMTWLRLAKLESAGVRLSRDARRRLEEFSASHSDWQLESDQQDEFSHWMTVSSGGGQQTSPKPVPGTIPADPEGLAAWLAQNPGDVTAHWEPARASWSELCRTNLDLAASALATAADRNAWPAAPWADALQAWCSDEETAARSWTLVAIALKRMPPGKVAAIANPLAWWLRSVAPALDPSAPAHEFISVCGAAAEATATVPRSDDDPVMSAINSNVGLIAEALLRLWLKRKPQPNQPLPDDIRPLLSSFCDLRRPELRWARVVLASASVVLFRGDPYWFKECLAPALDWDVSPTEAAPTWAGFVYTAQLYPPLLSEIHAPFVRAAEHYAALGRSRARYAGLLTLAALEPTRILEFGDLATALAALPLEGLVESAHTLVEALEGAGPGRAAYWRERIKPLIERAWPHLTESRSELALQFAKLAIASSGAFAEALGVLQGWLCPVNDAWRVVHSLLESNACQTQPEAALELLYRTVATRPVPPDDLQTCLQQIGQSVSRADHRYVLLNELASA